MGPVGPKWAPCWPPEPCYQREVQLCGKCFHAITSSYFYRYGVTWPPSHHGHMWPMTKCLWCMWMAMGTRVIKIVLVVGNPLSHIKVLTYCPRCAFLWNPVNPALMRSILSVGMLILKPKGFLIIQEHISITEHPALIVQVKLFSLFYLTVYLSVRLNICLPCLSCLGQVKGKATHWVIGEQKCLWAHALNLINMFLLWSSTKAIILLYFWR